MKRINLNAYRKQLQELQAAQTEKDFLPLMFVSVEPNGYFEIGHGSQYSKWVDIPEPRGFIYNKTRLFIEDFYTVPDGIYLPAEPLWYWCNAEERRRLIERSQEDDFTGWMADYINLIKALLARSISDTTIFIRDMQEPALNDLIENIDRFSLNELVERYQERRWFVPYSRPAQ